MKYLFSLLALGLVFVTACGLNVTRGSGKIVTETRPVSNFHRVELNGMGELNITQGDTESLTVETDDNLMPVITTKVNDGTLSIGYDSSRGVKSISPTRLVFTLQVINLDAFELSGAGNVTAPSLKSDTLTLGASGAGNLNFANIQAKTTSVNVSGVGNVVLTGQTDTQSAQLSGLGNYNAGDLKSTNASVSLSGAGNATVWASETVNVQISGAGGVSYYGTPQIKQSISGIGSVKSLGTK
jgi:hypothetical protein